MSALLNRKVEDGLFEEVAFKQRNTSVKVGSKFCEDLGKSFKSRSNSMYEVTMVEAHLICFRNNNEPVSLETHEYCEVIGVAGEQVI